ncbi:MAG: WYL domain-containing protein, partial [Burkholderiales bacterium]|nr:WYL domain-containing protein [Burkholderiales bacterium]
EMSPKEVAKRLDASYGIFSSGQLQWAELSFSKDRARWVSHEVWHEQQESWSAEDGRFHLRFPFSDPTELTMDILRHIPEVRVVSPESLRRQVNDAVLKFIQSQSSTPDSKNCSSSSASTSG